jgi:prostatic aicd phosphatase
MNFQVGGDYRSRYLSSASPYRILNISEFSYVSSQVYASAPDQGILLNTATAFMQGFYPPLTGLKPELSVQTLNNGSSSASPLGGYQYVVLHGEDTNSPDTIWIKGHDNCPVVADAAKSFQDSDEFKAKLVSTKDFYRGFYDVLKSVYDYTSPDNMTYAKAFDIFDLINVARIHNATSPARNVTADQLFQLRTLADSAEFASNYNATQPSRSIHAQALAGAILSQLNQTVTSQGKLKFSLLAGSYDNFLGFFGLVNLTSVSTDFFGLPDYASTMAFELFSTDTATFPSDPNSALRVRFFFRNSTFGVLTPFPLFGTGQDSLTWPDFVTRMQARAITSADEWCSACGSNAVFCPVPQTSPVSVTGTSGGMSNVVAGVIGAMVTLGVMVISGLLLFLLLRKRYGRVTRTASPTGEKTSLRSENEGTNTVQGHIY